MSMTQELMLKLQNHATGAETWSPPEQWYLAIFDGGVEAAGLGYERQPISFAMAVALSATHVRSGTSDSQVFENAPAFEGDELRIVDTASGAPTLTGWVIPHLRSITAGSSPGYAAGKIGTHLFATSEPPA